MSGTKTLIWAVVLLVVAAFYYFYEVEGGKKRQEAVRQRELLVHVVPDAVTGIVIKRPQETVRAEKREGQWHITEPLAVPGDEQKYRELVRYVADLRYIRLVEEQPSTLEPFGLDKPPLEVHLTHQDTTPAATLRLGNANPTGGSYYVQVEGKPAVYLIASVAKDVLDASLYALRDKTVLAFTPGDIQEIQVTHGETAPVTLQRQEGDAWRLTAPVQAPADREQVSGLLQRLKDVRIKAFIEEQPADLASYGLQKPALQLGLSTSTGQAGPTLLLGNVDTHQQGVYAKHGDAPRVFLLPQEFWDALPQTVAALRDKTLVRYEREHITRLELQFPTGTIVVTKAGERQYQLEQPESAAADDEAIYTLLGDIHALTAQDFVTDTPEAPATYGFGSPRLIVTLAETPPGTEQPSTSQTLLFGAEAPEGKGVYVKRGDAPTVYLVDREAAQRLLNTTAFDLRDKKLLPFTSETVQKIEVHYPTVKLTLERHGDAWRLTEPQPQEITQRWKVDDILYGLQRLEYAKIVAESATEDAHYGLDTPQVRVTLWQQDGMTIGPLVLGNTTDTEVAGTRTAYAQVGSNGPLYAIALDFLEHLPKTPADFAATN